MTNTFKLVKTATHVNIIVDGKIVGCARKSSAVNKWNGFAPGVTPTLPKSSPRAAARALMTALDA